MRSTGEYDRVVVEFHAGEYGRARRSERDSVTAAVTLDRVATGSYFPDMRAVGIKVLKNKLSEYVRLASSGEPILVTDRDRVVAELGPPGPGRSEWASDALLADAVRSGWLAPPTMPGAGPPRRVPTATAAVLLDELDGDREDR